MISDAVDYRPVSEIQRFRPPPSSHAFGVSRQLRYGYRAWRGVGKLCDGRNPVMGGCGGG